MPTSFPWVKLLLFSCLLVVFCAGEKVRMKNGVECKGELYIPFKPCVRYCRVRWMLIVPKYQEQQVADGTKCRRLLILRGVCMNGRCVKPTGAVTKPPRMNFTAIMMTAEATSTTPAPLRND
uniref:Basic tail secreted protein n=1 Tax=Rhipicephalus appendiculatus TaxID=34631 RepID=A0A131YFB3_RHIAP